MAVSVELRRHSARHHDEWGHLTTAGVDLARRIGSSLGPFTLVGSSPLPRAAETAIAMGFGIDFEDHELALVGEAAMSEIDWPMPFGEFARRHRERGGIWQRGRDLVTFLVGVANRLEEGASALLLSHGAVIEMATVAAVADTDFDEWGTHCGHCEGVRFDFEEGRVDAVQLLRVDGATGR